MDIPISSLLTPTISSPPVIYHRLQAVMNDPKSSFDDFAKIIKMDSGLTARLLKIVNSPFYGLEGQVETITHAMTVIGLEPLSDMVLATEVMNKFKGIPEDIIVLDDFWRHCIASGLGAQKIATVLGDSNIERYYLAGVLHDIGSLVMFMEIPVQCRLLIAQAKVDDKCLVEVEKEHLGFDHCEIGRLLLEKWRLPQNLIDAAHYHHDPIAADENTEFCASIYLSDIYAHELELGSSGEPKPPPRDLTVLHYLGISEENEAPLKKEVSRLFFKTIGLFL